MNKNQIKSIVTIISLTILSINADAQMSCLQEPTKIYIMANRLDKALIILSSQIDCKIIYDTKLVHSFKGSKLEGNLTPSDALIRLVKGTGLEVHAEHASLAINQADQQAVRIKVTTLQRSLKKAVESKKITQKIASQMYAELQKVKASVIDLAKKQGFVSAAEKASYQRTLDKIEQLVS